jgi:hypothetical protein
MSLNLTIIYKILAVPFQNIPHISQPYNNTGFTILLKMSN